MIRRAALALIALVPAFSPPACSPLAGPRADTPPAPAQPPLPAPAPPPLMIPHIADLPTRPAGAVLAIAGPVPVLTLPEPPAPQPPSGAAEPSPALPARLTSDEAATVLRAWQRYCARTQNLSADDIAVVYEYRLENLRTASGRASP